MNPFRIFLSLLLSSLSFAYSVHAEEPYNVYMLRLDDEIGSSTWRYTR